MNRDFAYYIRIALLVLVIFLALGLAWWYVFLRGQSSAIENNDTGRGLGAIIPSFSSGVGSTLQNVVDGFGFSATHSSTATKEPDRLWHVHTLPTAGHVFLTGSSTVRFLERATGYFFSADPKTGVVPRLTNTLIPQIYEAYGAGNGTFSAVTVGKNGARSYQILSVDTATSSNPFFPITQQTLGRGLFGVWIHDNGTQMVTAVDNGRSGVTFVFSNLDGTNPSTLFSSIINYWNFEWLRDGRMILTEAAGTKILGTSYELTANGTSAIARRVEGLTVRASASSTAVLIGSDNGDVRLAVRANTDATLVTLPIRTTAEKCAWGKGGNSVVAYCAVPETITSSQFLNDWYRGALHTSDTVWKIEPGAARAEKWYSPPGEAGVALDMEQLEVSDDGKYLAFRNATDKSLWILRLDK